MIISYVILATLNLSCVSVKGCPIHCIFFTYKTNASSSFLCNTNSLFFSFRDYVNPYMWFHNDMTSTLNIQPIVWILELWILDPLSIPSLQSNFDHANSHFFFKTICCLLNRDHIPWVVGTSSISVSNQNGGPLLTRTSPIPKKLDLSRDC